MLRSGRGSTSCTDRLHVVEEMVLRLRKEKYKLQLEDAGKESLRQKIAELKTVIAGGNGKVVEAVTATCEDAGSLAYWRDPLSGAIFEDGSGMKSLTLSLLLLQQQESI